MNFVLLIYRQVCLYLLVYYHLDQCNTILKINEEHYDISYPEKYIQKVLEYFNTCTHYYNLASRSLCDRYLAQVVT